MLYFHFTVRLTEAFNFRMSHLWVCFFRFSRTNQNAPGFGGTVQTGFRYKLRIRKSDFFNQSQEILSRYGAALSLKPA
jgi:hypothetical protein